MTGKWCKAVNTAHHGPICGLQQHPGDDGDQMYKQTLRLSNQLLQPHRVTWTTPTCNAAGAVQLLGALSLLFSPAPSPLNAYGCSCSSPTGSLAHSHGGSTKDTGGKGCHEKAGERAAAGTKPDEENASCTGVKLLLRGITSDRRSKVPWSRSVSSRWWR